jgi:hypothetical protein
MSSGHPSYTPLSPLVATLVLLAAAASARRVSARGDTLVTTEVMVWDGAGAWRQAIFRPIVQPRENLVVAAAEVDGPCR